MSEQHESPQRRGRVAFRDDPDKLLQAVEELRALEREKRLQDVSSEPFQVLARQVEEKARQVFRLAELEEPDKPDTLRRGALPEPTPDDD